MTRARRLGLACAAAFTLAVWGGFAALSRAETSSANGKDAPVAIQLFQFTPSPVAVEAGTRVTWTNQDDINHTVTSGTPENRDGRFDGKLSGKGTTFTFDFTQPGTYPYFCARHQSMRGEIRVNP